LKLLILGHLSVDVLHQPDGTFKESYGGIARVVQALSSLVEKGDRVIPVSGVHSDDLQSITNLFRSFPGVDTSGLYTQDAPTHRVQFFPREDGQAVACTKHIAPPIPFDRINDFLDVDGILINMFSGFDITLDTLDAIRMAVRSRGTMIHLDYHNLTQGVSREGERFRRPLVEWRRWAFMIDTVQLNEEELGGLTVERLNEEQIVGHFLALGVKGVVVTRGHRGACLYWSERKKVLHDDVAPEESETDDHAGMGDLFGAVFQFRHVKSSDMLASARFAQTFLSSWRRVPEPLLKV
jgi:sugar/nucleoside kinase (ribokinase family)